MKLRDKVIVKTYGGPHHTGIILVIKKFKKNIMYLISLDDYPICIWFFKEFDVSNDISIRPVLN